MRRAKKAENTARVVLLLGTGLAALLLNGCSAGEYWRSRGEDAGDLVTLTVGPSLGAKVSVGPLYLNTLGVYHVDSVGRRFGDWLKNSESEGQDSDIGAWIAVGQSWHVRTESQKRRGKGPEYFMTDFPFVLGAQRPPRVRPGAPLELIVGLGGGVRFGVDPVEVLDFLLGWFGLDLLLDDIDPEPQDMPEASAPSSLENASSSVG